MESKFPNTDTRVDGDDWLEPRGKIPCWDVYVAIQKNDYVRSFTTREYAVKAMERLIKDGDMRVISLVEWRKKNSPRFLFYAKRKFRIHFTIPFVGTIDIPLWKIGSELSELTADDFRNMLYLTKRSD